jgi:hypothetical protein
MADAGCLVLRLLRLRSDWAECAQRESPRRESRAKKSPATHNQRFTESNLLGEKAA